MFILTLKTQITLKTKPKTKIMGWNQSKYENYKRLLRYDYSMGYINGIQGLQKIYLTFIAFDEFECAKVVDEFCKEEKGIDISQPISRKPERRRIKFV